MLLSDRIAKASVTIGVSMMLFAGIFGMAEGQRLHASQRNRVFAMRLLWSGAAVAVIVPTIVTCLCYWKTKKHGQNLRSSQEPLK